MIPGVPPGKMWLASVKAHLGVGERNPKAARILEILSKRVGDITIEWNFIRDELNTAQENVYGKNIFH